MQSEMSIEIDRPIEAVFDFTTNNVAEWSLTVVEEELFDQTPDVVGSMFRIVTEERGKRMVFDGVVTLHEPPTAHSIHLKGQPFNIDAEYRFEDLGGRTRVTQRSTVTGKGLVKVLFAAIGWMMRKSCHDALAKELQNLKRLVEARTPAT